MGELLSEAQPPSLEDRVRGRLAAEWAFVESRDVADPTVPANVMEGIRKSVNSKTKTYRYVLPSQLLPKLVEPSLDCRTVQAGAALAGSFDARSICQHVIVPFDRANNNVLGGSSEPYANNPLRIPAIVADARAAQKDKLGFDNLRVVLDYAEDHADKVESLVRLTLAAVRSRLAEVSVVYPVPNRASLGQASDALSNFLDERSGGLRMQAVAVALFRTIGERFGLFREVRSNHINAADASTGSAADLECVGAAGEVVLAVEVKDRQLELRQVQDKLPGVREKGVRELLFLIQGGIVGAELEPVQELISRQFVTGQNVYVVEWSSFTSSCLVLFGEEGRRDFLKHVGRELDERKVDIRHRRQWASLLELI